MKLLKNKDKQKSLKATREKRQITYKGTIIRIMDNFSTKIMESRRQW